MEVCVRANCQVGQGANVSERVWVSMRAWRELFLLFILFLCTCGYDSVRACRGDYFEVFDIRGGHFGVFDSQRHFPSCFSSFLSVLALGPTVPLSSLESTPVSILVPKQVDCNMCRFSKLLLFSFFFCKDGSDRLMKRASYSCRNFLCIVLAVAYLKYRLCRLSCLPFVWHLFFIVTHTHTY